MPISLLEDSLRDTLNKTSKRIMSVKDPIMLTIDGLEEGYFDLDDVDGSSRKIFFSNKIYIERGDFMEHPNGDFFRLSIGKCVRLKGIGIVRADEIVKDGDNIFEVKCSLVEGVKVKSTIHWVSAKENVVKPVIVCHGMDKIEIPVIFERSVDLIEIGENIQLMRHGYAVNWGKELIFTCELKK
jgi:glutaminyl-tRNA synthetase